MKNYFFNKFILNLNIHEFYIAFSEFYGTNISQTYHKHINFWILMLHLISKWTRITPQISCYLLRGKVKPQLE